MSIFIVSTKFVRARNKTYLLFKNYLYELMIKIITHNLFNLYFRKLFPYFSVEKS